MNTSITFQARLLVGGNCKKDLCKIEKIIEGNEMKIIAVVVTYNRKKLLVECLEAIQSQSYKVDKIILIDNASTDGTYSYLKNEGCLNEQVDYICLPSNIGGAGGFYTGIRKAFVDGADWIWIMDDDTIPNERALEAFLDSLNNIRGEISYLASSVFGINGESMNVPSIDTSCHEGVYTDWYRFLEHGVVKITKATFVSLLINRKSIECCGLPCKDYFIWGDDTEYTIRITQNYAPAYLIGSSTVIHKRNVTKPIFISDEENLSRMRMHYYFVRNNLLNSRTYYGKGAVLKATLSYLHVCWTILLQKEMKRIKIKTILKGIFDYYLKKYDVVAFKNRFDFNGQEQD